MHLIAFVAVVAAALIVPHTDASFCGESSIPFSFEALPNGQPVLGCARPVCFGYGADGRPLNSKPASFYRIYNRPDGYVRKALPNASPKPIPYGAEFQPQLSRCSDVFESKQCAADNQWVGGIAPSLNLGNPIGLQCCDYDLLRESKDRGVAVVRPNQVVYGGEVLNGDRLSSFDYISNIVRYVNHQDQSVYYEVSMRRFPCLDRPENGTNELEQGVGDEIMTRFGQPKKYPFEPTKPQKDISKIGQPRAYQATRMSAEQPIPPPQQPARAYSAGHQAQAGGAPQSLELEIENVEPNSVQLVQHHQPIYQPSSGCAVGSSGCGGGGGGQPQQQQSNWCYLPQAVAPSYCQQQSAPAPSYCGSAGVCGQQCCSSGGGSGFSACFSGDTLVQLADGGNKRMDELDLGDWVLSASRDNGMVFSRVDSWMHRVADEERDFIQLSLDDGKQLKLTRGHFIYRTQCTGDRSMKGFEEVFRESPVLAKDIKEGDCMFAVDETSPADGLYERRVESIAIVTEQGFYAPLTGNGNIVVQGVLSSCYNEVDHDVLQHTAFGALRPIQNFFGSLFSGESDALKVELPMGMEMLMNHVMPYVVPKTAVGM